jgi:hypothetical protein
MNFSEFPIEILARGGISWTETSRTAYRGFDRQTTQLRRYHHQGWRRLVRPLSDLCRFPAFGEWVRAELAKRQKN